MKKIKFYKHILPVIFGIFLVLNITSCEQEEEYENLYVISGDVGLTYVDITTFPFQNDIVTDAPTFNIDNSVYRFRIVTIALSDGTPVDLNDFSVEGKSGIITIDNNEGILLAGKTYHFDIGIDNVNGTIFEENSFILTVLDIPLDYEITNDTAEANFLEEKDLATVTYVDTSDQGVIEDVSYSLDNPPTGFTIDTDTGVISKNTEASSGVHKISVIIHSNLGSKTFTDVLTVTVGDAPTIQYVMADGITALSQTVLSPWTAYTTAIPILDGMTATEYEIILPGNLPAGSIIANADGTISVLADQNLITGDHIMGVIATNSSGASATFDNIFTLSVETRWETPAVFFEDFNNAPDPSVTPNEYNSKLNTYFLNNSVFAFVVQNTTSKNVFTAKLAEGKVDGGFESIVDASLVLELTMQPEWRKMRVAFTEGFGFGDNRLDWYVRTLSSSHNISDLEAGTFDGSNWNTIMNTIDASWSGTSVWKTLSSDSDLNQVPFKDVEIIPGNTSVFLNWRVEKTGTASGGAVFLVDDINVEVSNAFDAEEF